jgi:dihydropteroate synthase
MYTLNLRGRLFVIDRPQVMGILNITPDSFFAGSRTPSVQESVERAGRMLEQGAAILDIGGQSTRPGSTRIDAAEEAARVLPVIEAIVRAFPAAVLSIDTYHASVAEAAVKVGASIVNDISGGHMDTAMLPTVGGLGVPYVCMHMQGVPETMQETPEYAEVTRDVLDYFIRRVADCRAAGIRDIILDPGFGFGKTMSHNFELFRNMEALHMAGLPLLIGWSRKSTIWKTLGISAAESLNGTTVMHTLAVIRGAAILRVHDVREAVEVVNLLEAAGEWTGFGKVYHP